jgi:putative membrane protein
VPSARLDRLALVPLAIRALIHWALNVLALLVADWVFDGFSIERWWPVLLAGAVLGLANVFLKPLVTFIALPLILLTFGVAYFFVNVVMLLFTEWVTPDFSIDGFWTYVGATIVIWLVNWLGSLAIVAALDDD